MSVTRISGLLRGTFLTLLVLWNLCGCGDSTADFVATSTDTHATTSFQSLSGTFFLGDTVAGATVEVQDLQGNTLLTSLTDESGNFVFLYPSLPPRIRVVARLGQMEFSSEALLTPEEPDAFVAVTIPTTILSRYLQQHPETTLEQVQSWLSQAVDETETIDWSIFLEESNRFAFSHLGFFAVAAQNGGVEATITSLLQGMQLKQQQSETSDLPIFQLDSSDLLSSLDTLESDLHPVAESLRTLLAEDAVKAPESFKIGSFIAQGVGGYFLNGIVDSIWGWLLTAMGLNDDSIARIQMQLDQIQRQLVALSHQVDRSQFEQAAAHINTEAIVPITVLTEQMSSILRVTNATSSSLDEMRRQLTEFQAASALLTMQNYLLGTNNQTNILALSLRRKMSSHGIQQQPNFMNFPVRSNKLLKETLEVFELYEGYQVLAMNLLAETAHLQDNPANHIPLASERLKQAIFSLKKQRQQLPQPLPSDRVLADLQFGLMWYLDVQSPRTKHEAERFAKGFKLVGSDGIVYDDWRLPYFWELEALQARGRYSGGKDPKVKTWGTGGYGYIGNSAAGLPALGFKKVDSLNEKGGLWSKELSRSTSLLSDIPTISYDFIGNINGTNLQREAVYRDGARSRGKAPFILVRSVGRPLGEPFFETSPPYPQSRQIRPEEGPSLGVPSSISALSVEGSEVKSTITYTVHTGGSFRCGDSGSGQDFSFVRRSPQVQVSREASDIVTYSSQDPSLFDIWNLLGHEGRIVWHTATSESTSAELSASIYGASRGIFPVDIHRSEKKELLSQAKVLIGVSVFPRNRAYPDARNLPGSLLYSAVGFYSDNSVSDLTSEVVWKVTDPNGQSVDGADFSSNFPGSLLLDDPESGDLVIEAQLRSDSSKTDRTALKVGIR